MAIWVKVPIDVYIHDPNQNAPYSGAVLKAYQVNTTTEIPLATNYTGAGQATSFSCNASGFFQTAGGMQIYPHITTAYSRADFVLFPNQTAADADDTSGALYVWEDLAIIEMQGNTADATYASVAALIASSDNSALNTIYINSFYAVSYPSTAGSKGGHYAHRTGGTNTSPTPGGSVSAGSIGTGVYAGYYYDQDGVEWKISETNTPYNSLMFGGYDDGTNTSENTTAWQNMITYCESLGDSRKGAKITGTPGNHAISQLCFTRGRVLNIELPMTCVLQHVPTTPGDSMFIDSGTGVFGVGWSWIGGRIEGDMAGGSGYIFDFDGGQNRGMSFGHMQILHNQLTRQYTGTHDGSDNAAVLSDAGASFGATDALVGMIVVNVTDRSWGIITASTGTTATATLTGGEDNEWDASDSYIIDGRGYDVFNFPDSVGNSFDFIEGQDTRSVIHEYQGDQSVPPSTNNKNHVKGERVLLGTSWVEDGNNAHLSLCKAEVGAGDNAGVWGYRFEDTKNVSLYNSSSEDSAAAEHYFFNGCDGVAIVQCALSGSATYNSVYANNCEGLKIYGGRANGQVELTASCRGYIIEALELERDASQLVTGNHGVQNYTVAGIYQDNVSKRRCYNTRPNGAGYADGWREDGDSFNRIEIHNSGAIYAGDGAGSPVRVITEQQAAISGPTGGATVDSESRTAINSILTALRAHGLIDT